MKKLLLLAAAVSGLAGSASAAVITLESVAANGANDFTFTYQGTLGPDEGVRAGDRLIIYDFAGYIPGSIFTPSADLVASIENSSMSLITPGFADDPTIANLVFTYVGPDFRAKDGPLVVFDFDGLGARSTLGGTTLTSFFSRTTKNNPNGQPGGAGTAIFTLGSVASPGVVPEPATWALMIGGFGMAGLAMRRRTTIRTVTA